MAPFMICVKCVHYFSSSCSVQESVIIADHLDHQFSLLNTFLQGLYFIVEINRWRTNLRLVVLCIPNCLVNKLPHWNQSQSLGDLVVRDVVTIPQGLFGAFLEQVPCRAIVTQRPDLLDPGVNRI